MTSLVDRGEAGSDQPRIAEPAALSEKNGESSGEATSQELPLCCYQSGERTITTRLANITLRAGRIRAEAAIYSHRFSHADEPHSVLKIYLQAGTGAATNTMRFHFAAVSNQT
jgi:hypothetical protein